MAHKFIAFIPARGDKNSFGSYRSSKSEEFHNKEAAKVWIGRQIVADPDLDEGFIYLQNAKVRLNKLIADHTEIVDVT